ncbi:response regulator transcription factor [Phycicoccus sp. MAQZ13P-2]|uniref:response regulator transcription factor n=1 Tax=Phycicoccus mangrovi TaxID=2840470 RepID=UPI001C008AF6|nr:response regulator transcription factor [Phycicoccus mangrovi]MBT9257141.1 response regulator transcription factor [Phycicoccus mangrovi]MBT9276360.1 response regulator transcription factor [Phycicoccus mangrovi]
MVPMYNDDCPDVLIVEDDEEIGRQVTDGLRAAGHPTRWSRTGHGGIEEARRRPPRVVLLDLGLPDIDGVDVARRLRAEHPAMLVVVLTARSDDMDVVIGLDAGADDYLTKPFSMTVLLARLRAHLRSQPAPAATAGAKLTVGPLRVDAAARRCALGDVEVELRAKELDLLIALASRAGSAVSRENLMAEVWDENWFGSTKTLDVTMAALRQRLTAAAVAARVAAPAITTLRGHGYRLEQAEVPEALRLERSPITGMSDPGSTSI